MGKEKRVTLIENMLRLLAASVHTWHWTAMTGQMFSAWHLLYRILSQFDTSSSEYSLSSTNPLLTREIIVQYITCMAACRGQCSRGLITPHWSNNSNASIINHSDTSTTQLSLCTVNTALNVYISHWDKAAQNYPCRYAQRCNSTQKGSPYQFSFRLFHLLPGRVVSVHLRNIQWGFHGEPVLIQCDNPLS